KIEDFISFNVRPLLNYVFFDENSSKLSTRYKQINQTEAQNFTNKNLQNLDPLETYYQVLNIYGFRLSQDQSEQLTLVGTNSNLGPELNNLELSKNRALEIKKYLVNIWNIDSNRIKIESRNLPRQASRSDTLTGVEENRRVEFISSELVSGSVQTVDTLRKISQTTIRFKPDIESEAGIKNWNLIVKQNNNTLKQFQGNDFPNSNLDWSLNSDTKNIPVSSEQIEYRLEVSDSVGQKYNTKVKNIPIDKLTIDRKRLERKADKEYEYYSLILFQYGRFDLGNKHKKTVDFVKSRISNNSKVTIIGHTDKIGDENINKRISLNRATAVAKRLKIPNAIVIGSGESNILFDNNLPEGRFYCRTVRIEVETKVEN
ncbi:OmpA family protein, partial [Candidatus Kapabacteria bacterium]|nr:OmpA family protein [Candidatus Kapabacteria bacterium]